MINKHNTEYKLEISKNGERKTVKKHAKTKQCDVCLKFFPENKTYCCATEEHDIYETVCKGCF